MAISMGASSSVSLATTPVYFFSGPNQTISANVFGSPLVVKTSAQFAGAIYSLTWKGQEFIDRADHADFCSQLSVTMDLANV